MEAHLCKIASYKLSINQITNWYKAVCLWERIVLVSNLRNKILHGPIIENSHGITFGRVENYQMAHATNWLNTSEEIASQLQYAIKHVKRQSRHKIHFKFKSALNKCVMLQFSEFAACEFIQTFTSCIQSYTKLCTVMATNQESDLVNNKANSLSRCTFESSIYRKHSAATSNWSKSNIFCQMLLENKAFKWLTSQAIFVKYLWLCMKPKTTSQSWCLKIYSAAWAANFHWWTDFPHFLCGKPLWPLTFWLWGARSRWCWNTSAVEKPDKNPSQAHNGCIINLASNVPDCQPVR